MSRTTTTSVDSVLKVPADSQLAKILSTRLDYLTLSSRNQYTANWQHGQRFRPYWPSKCGLFLEFPRHTPSVVDVEVRVQRKFYLGAEASLETDIKAWGETEDIMRVQQNAMTFLENRPLEDCIVTMPCGYGKSFVGIREAVRSNRWTIIFAHNTGILNGWKSKIIKHTNVSRVGSIISGSLDLKPITLALLQSFLALSPEDRELVTQLFGTVIFDEMHHLSARTFFQVANQFPGRRIGLSATPTREDGLAWLYQLVLGTNHFIGSAERKKAAVYFKYLDVSVDVESNYQRAVTQLAFDETYMSAIEADIRKGFYDGQKQLIIASRRVLIDNLAQMLSDLNPGIIYDGVSHEDREDALRNRKITLATPQLAQEGLDEPTLTTLRVVTPMKDRNNVIQVVGRLERDIFNKEAEAYFYVPVVPYFMSTAKKAKSALTRHGYIVHTL